MGVRRKAARGRREYSDMHFLQLRCGFDFLSEAWGETPFSADTLEDMRDCWDGWHEEITAEHISGFPGTRPWAYWTFTRPGERVETLPQAEQLFRWGELSQDELHSRRVIDSGRYCPEFRRTWTHWQDYGGRNWKISEAQQLVEMGELTAFERRAMVNPRGMAASSRRHLTQIEAQYLHLPVLKFCEHPTEQVFNRE